MTDAYTPPPKVPMIPGIIIGLLIAALVGVVLLFSGRIEAANQRARDEEKRSAAALADVAKLQGQMNTLQTELEATRMEVNEARLAGTRLLAELTETKAESGRRQRAIDEMKAQIAQLQEDVRQAGALADTAREETTEAQTATARITRELSDAKIAANEAARVSEESRAKLADVQSRLATAQEQLTAAQSKKR